MLQASGKHTARKIDSERVEKCLKSVRELAGPIEDQSFVISDLNFESIDIVDLLFVTEQEFGVVMTMLEFNQFVLSCLSLRNAVVWDFTVAELKDYLESRVI